MCTLIRVITNFHLNRALLLSDTLTASTGIMSTSRKRLSINMYINIYVPVQTGRTISVNNFRNTIPLKRPRSNQKWNELDTISSGRD